MGLIPWSRFDDHTLDRMGLEHGYWYPSHSTEKCNPDDCPYCRKEAERD